MDRMILPRSRGLQEALKVADLADLQTIGLSYGRKEHGLGALGQELEEVIGDLHGILPIGFSFLEKEGDTLIHGLDELIDTLRFKVRRDLKEFLSMGGMFDLLFSLEGSGMGNNLSVFDTDLDVIGIGKDFATRAREGGRDRVTVGIQRDKTGLTDQSLDDPVRLVMNLR